VLADHALRESNGRPMHGLGATGRPCAGWLNQPASAIETALRFYDAHRADIDDRTRRNEEAAERVARARQAAS
jgi:hypothetical protein